MVRTVVVSVVLLGVVAWVRSTFAAEGEQLVPTDTRFSIGVGVTPGENLFTSPQLDPNPAIAVRVNLSEEFVLEPVLLFVFKKQKDVDASYGVDVQGLAKYAFVNGNRTRLYALGGLNVSYKKGGDGKDLGSGLLLGFGGEYFFTKHWSISLDIISPLLRYVWSKRGDKEDWTFTASIQSTTVRPAVHVYF